MSTSADFSFMHGCERCQEGDMAMGLQGSHQSEELLRGLISAVQRLWRSCNGPVSPHSLCNDTSAESCQVSTFICLQTGTHGCMSRICAVDKSTLNAHHVYRTDCSAHVIMHTVMYVARAEVEHSTFDQLADAAPIFE